LPLQLYFDTVYTWTPKSELTAFYDNSRRQSNIDVS